MLHKQITSAQLSNWYQESQRFAEDNLEEWLKKQKKDEDFQNQLNDQTGLWTYPFASVKKDDTGFYIDWNDESGGISDIRKVQPGQKIADHTIGGVLHGGYWEVTSVDVSKGMIYLKPIGNNPHLTGVGAGGAVFTDSDFEILSGETERKCVDNVLDRINTGQVSRYDDVRYILTGTVPYQFGPNGGQGGWYSTTDLRNNRGGRKGMDARDIMMADARMLQDKFRFEVPPKALDGTLDSYTWDMLVNSPMQIPTRPEELEDVKLPCENFQDPKIMYRNVLEHPQPEVKFRNFEQLKKMFTGEYPWQTTKKENEDEVRRRWRNGEYGRPDLKPLLRQLCQQLSTVKHPSPSLKHDPYWQIREAAILFAQDQGWNDVVQHYEKASDGTNREYVIHAYEALQDVKGILRVEATETNPEVLKRIIYALQKLKIDTGPIVAAGIDRYRAATKQTGDVYHDYHGKELLSALGWNRRTAGVQQLEMPIKVPTILFPTSKLPPESDWHAARIINQIIRDNPDELRNYEEYAWQDGATDAQRSKKGLQAYKEELSSRYGEVLETLRNMPDPVPVYRAINVEVGQTLDSIQEAIDHNGFGVYWSYRPDGAIPHQGGRGRTITLYAYAPSQIVDWRRSLELNLACPDEMELRLFPGRNLIVYRINADGTGRRTDKDWNVAWRGKT